MSASLPATTQHERSANCRRQTLPGSSLYLAFLNAEPGIAGSIADVLITTRLICIFGQYLQEKKDAEMHI